MLITKISNTTQGKTREYKKQNKTAHNKPQTNLNKNKDTYLFYALFNSISVMQPGSFLAIFPGKNQYQTVDLDQTSTFPPCKTTKTYPGDQTHAREVTRLEVTNFNYSTFAGCLQKYRSNTPKTLQTQQETHTGLFFRTTFWECNQHCLNWEKSIVKLKDWEFKNNQQNLLKHIINKRIASVDSLCIQICLSQ